MNKNNPYYHYDYPELYELSWYDLTILNDMIFSEKDITSPLWRWKKSWIHTGMTTKVVIEDSEDTSRIYRRKVFSEAISEEFLVNNSLDPVAKFFFEKHGTIID